MYIAALILIGAGIVYFAFIKKNKKNKISGDHYECSVCNEKDCICEKTDNKKK